ncbi:hypothetical protein [Cohnella cellulosilytica]|uniref:Uncharacterized protein n=1 Tax=Cohnella cellulosilytica TaxID=986710 RepID=A0ABW2FC06_9BACL
MPHDEPHDGLGSSAYPNDGLSRFRCNRKRLRPPMFKAIDIWLRCR